MGKVSKWMVYEKVWSVPDLSPSERLLLLALAKFWVPGKPVKCSQDTLAALMCCKRTTVNRALKSLSEKELLFWNSGNNFKNVASAYEVPIFDALTVFQNETYSVSKSSPTVYQNETLKYKRNINIYISNRDSVSVYSSVQGSECFRVSLAYVLKFVPLGASAELLKVMARFEAHNVFKLAKSSDQVLHAWWIWLGNEYSSSVEGNNGRSISEGKSNE